jgi:hypothetical protein
VVQYNLAAAFRKGVGMPSAPDRSSAMGGCGVDVLKPAIMSPMLNEGPRFGRVGVAFWV